MKITKVLSAMLALAIAGTVTASAKSMECEIGSSKLYFSDNGQIAEQTADVSPIIINDRTMVPVRVISESFGCTVDWNDATRTITINDGVMNVVITVDSTAAYINGVEYTLDVPPQIVDERTLVPLRFISEALGKYVYYVDETRGILIEDDNPAISINGEEITYDDFRAFLMLNGMMPTRDQITEEYEQEFFDGTVYNMSIAHMAYKSETNNKEYLKAAASQAMEIKSDIYSAGMLFTNFVRSMTKLESTFLANHNLDSISLDEAKEAYKKNYVCAKHILIGFSDASSQEETRKKAEDVLAKAKAGEDFDSLITEYGEDPGAFYNPKGYVFTYGEMVEPFEKASFALSEGEISDLVETEYGYHIIQKQALPEFSDEYAAGAKTAVLKDKIEAARDSADIKLFCDAKQFCDRVLMVK